MIVCLFWTHLAAVVRLTEEKQVRRSRELQKLRSLQTTKKWKGCEAHPFQCVPKILTNSKRKLHRLIVSLTEDYERLIFAVATLELNIVKGTKFLQKADEKEQEKMKWNTSIELKRKAKQQCKGRDKNRFAQKLLSLHIIELRQLLLQLAGLNLYFSCFPKRLLKFAEAPRWAGFRKQSRRTFRSSVVEGGGGLRRIGGEGSHE